MRFGMYFKIILNKKWLFSCRNIHTNYSCTHMLESSGADASSPDKILKWCSLVRFEVYFDQIVY